MNDLKDKYAAMFREELLERCAPFWLKGADNEYGGILNCLDNEGNVYATDKGVWMQGRTAWTYAHLYRKIEAKSEYIELSRSCIDFMDRYCFDSDGRMLDTVTRDGKPVSKSTELFSEAFYISGCIEYWLATGDRAKLEAARRCYEMIIDIYTEKSEDPYKISSNFKTSRPMKALCTPMILLNVTGIIRDADTENIEHYNSIADRLVTDIHAFHDKKNNVMRESVGVDGTFHDEFSDGRVVNPGHDLECSWFLLEEALFRKNKDIEEFSRTVYGNAMRIGWDGEFGGLMYYRDAIGSTMELLDFDMRIWWAHCEGIIASLELYAATKDNAYKNDFEKFTEYSFSHFSDKENGEWYGMLHRDGTPTLPPFKGHTYKGAFHVMRMLMKVITLLDAE